MNHVNSVNLEGRVVRTANGSGTRLWLIISNTRQETPDGGKTWKSTTSRIPVRFDEGSLCYPHGIQVSDMVRVTGEIRTASSGKTFIRPSYIIKL